MTQLIAMAVFSFVMSITPGPVNITTLSSGFSYGFRATIPFVSGATIGFTALLAAVGLGVGSVVSLFPVVESILRYSGAAFICYVGWKIALAEAAGLEYSKGSRPKFFHGAVMQWLNIKAWVACLAGVSVFDLAGSYGKLFLFCAIYFTICYVSIASWAVLGNAITKLFHSRKQVALLNVLLGGSLVILGVLLAFGGEIFL